MDGSNFTDPFGNKKPLSQIGAGEGEVPLAKSPAPSLEVRTFSSDLQSVRSTGGGEPMPYAPRAPSAPLPQSPTPPAPSGMSPFGGGAIPPPSVPPQGLVAPARSVGGPANIPAPVVPPQKSGKKIFVALAAFLIVVALGAVGYFFVYPLLTENGAAAITPAQEIPPVLPAPEAEPVPPEPEAASPEPSSPTADPFEGIRGISSHASVFRTAPDATIEVILTAPTLAAFRSAFPSGNIASPLFTEAVVKMPSGAVFPFSTLAPLIAPAFFTDTRLSSFDDDATYFTYAAPNGTWLGIVARLKPGAPIGPVQDAMSGLQRDPNLANFFLEDPGSQGVWADGSVKGKPASQVTFSGPGATFSYAWFDRNLLLSTNLTAAEEAATRLGF